MNGLKAMLGFRLLDGLGPRAIPARRQKPTFVVLAVVLTACFVALCMALTAAVHRRALSLQNLAAVTMATTAASQVLPAAPSQSFVDRLPREVHPQSVLDALQQHCVRAGVHVEAVRFQTAPARGDALGKLEAHIVFKGDYPSIKQVLADLLDEHEAMTVQRLEFTKSTTDRSVRANAVLALWTQTLQSP